MISRDRLIVALDLPDAEAAQDMIDKLGDCVCLYKIGMELIYNGSGISLARQLIDTGHKVFIDLKLHDIPNTVEKAVGQIARWGAFFLSVHAYPQTMKAAIAGAAGSDLRLLGVSVLTSMDDEDLVEAGYAHKTSSLVTLRAKQAEAIGLAGLVASAADAGRLRAQACRLTLVCPGVRPAQSVANDQKRFTTPTAAIATGADYLVVGRPITYAADPRASVAAILEEI